MKIICTKAEFASMVRNCKSGYCSSCVLYDVCQDDNNGKANGEDEVRVEDYVSEIIMEDKNA